MPEPSLPLPSVRHVFYSGSIPLLKTLPFLLLLFSELFGPNAIPTRRGNSVNCW